MKLYVLLALIVAIVALSGGCAGPMPTRAVFVPDSATPTITSVKIATTQVSIALDKVSGNLEVAATSVSTAVDQIAFAANNGKARTQPNLQSFWDSILKELPPLAKVQDVLVQSSQAVKDQKARVDQLGLELERANAAEKTERDFWTAQDASCKKQIADLNAKNTKLTDDRDKAFNDRLIWISLISIVLIGLSIAIGKMLNFPMVVQGGVMAFGTTLGISVLLLETHWIIKWIAVGLVIIGFVVVIWQIYQHRKAISALVQSREKQLQLAPAQTKAYLLGHGAFVGKLHDDEKPAAPFIAHFKKSVRNAPIAPIIDLAPSAAPPAQPATVTPASPSAPIFLNPQPSSLFPTSQS